MKPYVFSFHFHYVNYKNNLNKIKNSKIKPKRKNNV